MRTLTVWLASASNTLSSLSQVCFNCGAERLRFSHVQPSGVGNGPFGSHPEGPRLWKQYEQLDVSVHTQSMLGELFTELNCATEEHCSLERKANCITASEKQKFLLETLLTKTL